MSAYTETLRQRVQQATGLTINDHVMATETTGAGFDFESSGIYLQEKTATIQVPQAEFSDFSVAHELWHLALYHQGVPDLTCILPNSQVATPVLTELGQAWYHVSLHRIIFPRLAEARLLNLPLMQASCRDYLDHMPVEKDDSSSSLALARLAQLVDLRLLTQTQADLPELDQIQQHYPQAWTTASSLLTKINDWPLTTMRQLRGLLAFLLEQTDHQIVKLGLSPVLPPLQKMLILAPTLSPRQRQQPLQRHYRLWTDVTLQENSREKRYVALGLHDQQAAFSLTLPASVTPQQLQSLYQQPLAALKFKWLSRETPIIN